MSVLGSFMIGLVLVRMTTSADFGRQNFDAYLVENNGRKTLKEPLAVDECQDGVAGKSYLVWRIESSGDWRVARFRLNRDGTEHVTPIRGGKLSSEQLETLAKVFSAQNLVGLPEKTGQEAKINPHWITVKYGRRTAKLDGLPTRRNLRMAEVIRKAAPANEKAANSVWERFAQVVQAVESHCPETAQK
jgi:hypothetical protein